MQAKNEVLKRLPQLNRKELQEVLARVNFLLGDGKQELSGDWLLEGFIDELRSRGLVDGTTYPRRVLVKSNDLSAARDHLLTGYKTPLSATGVKYPEKLALARLGASAILAYLAKIKVPPGPKTLLINIDKLPVALEECFPGYWQAHALGLCLKG